METYKLKNGNTLQIIQDDSDQSPREWDNLGTMVCFHRNYNLSDKHNYRHGDYTGWKDLFNAINKKEKAIVILPVYLYDHSGITISTSPFSCPWDSGQVGFIFVGRDKLLKEHNVKRLTPKIKESAVKALEGEIETFDQFLRGDVYGFKVIDPDGEDVDSCWGFYGSDPKINGMLEHVGKDLLVEY